jgi:hypothetical protein
MQALRYTRLSHPSTKVRNRQPAARDQRYTHGEAMRRARARRVLTESAIPESAEF